VQPPFKAHQNHLPKAPTEHPPTERTWDGSRNLGRHTR